MNGIPREAAHVVSTDAGGRPVYGGTPADFAVVRAIRELKAGGLRVTFYPFILMDVGTGITLPDPYSDHAATPGQPVHPWRAGSLARRRRDTRSVDQTAAAATWVAAFFGSASPAHFTVDGDRITWTGAIAPGVCAG